ncbi:MAG: AAA family ATPase [Bacteroidota bacterium]
MKIHKLTLKNYRCFDEFEILFPDSYTDESKERKDLNLHVLLAPNMAGKSAILKAIRIGIATILQKVKVNVAGQYSLNISSREHRVIGNNPFSDIAREVEIILLATFENLSHGAMEDKTYEWKRYKEDYSGRNTKTSHIQNDIAKDVNSTFNKVSELKIGVIPLFMFIGTEYIHQQKPVTDTLTQDGSIKQGYWYCLDDKSMESYVFDWFQKLYVTTVEQQRSELANAFYDTFAADTIHTFKKAVQIILPDIINVDWIRNIFVKSDKYMLAFQIASEGIRTYDMLSDGYRYLVLLIGELVTRATLLNKHLGRDVLSEITGIVLIDEFGIHLHPNLQSDTLTRLSKLFPKVQFIVTTHSPLLINGLRKEQLHIISENEDGHRTAQHPDEDAIGLGAEGILREMFGLDSTFDEKSVQLNEEYKVLLKKKNAYEISDEDLQRFEDLSKILAPVRLDPTLTITEDDPVIEIVKDRLKEETEKFEKSVVNTQDLHSRVNSIMDDLLKG